MRVNAENIATVNRAYTCISDTRARAKPGAMRVVEVRANGAVKTWMTRPGEFRAPFKYGLRDCFYVTHLNCGGFFTTEEEAAELGSALLVG
jgi:hypothetical protein